MKMKNENNSTVLGLEATKLKQKYFELEEREIKLAGHEGLRVVSVSVVLLQELFRLTHWTFNTIVLLEMPLAYKITGEHIPTLKQAMEAHKIPEWVQQKMMQDPEIGNPYHELLVSRQRVAEARAILNTTDLVTTLAELEQLLELIRAVIGRAERVIALKREYSKLAHSAWNLRSKISAVSTPWSQYSAARQGKFISAYNITKEVKHMLKGATKTFKSIDLQEALSNFLAASGLLRNYQIWLKTGKKPFRRLVRQSRNLMRPLERLFGISPEAFLSASLDYFHLQLEQIDLHLNSAHERV
jgi:hypothetical protein